MCDKIVVNQGEIEISTPKQFNMYLGCYPVLYNDVDYAVNLEEYICLCDFDLEKSLNGLKIAFTREFGNKAGDYYIDIDLDY